MTLQVEKLKTHRAFERIAEQIQENIVSGNLQPGDILPAEIKLKEMFNASRPTIREALRVLEQKGLVEIKSGAKGGAFIKHLGDENIADGLSLLLQLKKISIQSLTEFRAHMEPFAARLAAKRATANDREMLNSLRKKLENVNKGSGTNWEELRQLDVDVHLAIARISGNQLIETISQVLFSTLIADYDKIYFEDNNFVTITCSELCQIIDAIIQRNSTRAEKIALKHLNYFDEFIRLIILKNE